MKRVLYFLTLFLAFSCANQGSGPDGGPYDETPPKIVSMTQKKSKVTIKFDEAIKMENASEKVVVSPPQQNPPEISAEGRKISVNLLDDLLPNTTYTIDFSDAITDANEGNPMGNFTYIFSTGETTDTMEISGYVLDAENLEPLKGMTVGIFPMDSAKNAFRTTPLPRVGKTDGNGHFSIKGVAEGNYRIYALNDTDQDFKLSMKSEKIAWNDETIVPSCFPDVKYDTCWVDSTTIDSIRTIPYTHYMPDNVVMLAAQEDNLPRHYLKMQREEPEMFKLFFTGKSLQTPEIQGLNFNATDAFLRETNKFNDTISYWLKDEELVKLDTLKFTLTYEESDDSTGIRTLRTDTIESVPRHTLAKRLKQKADELEKWQKQQEKKRKKGGFIEENPPVEYVKQTGRISSKITPMDVVHLEFSEPLKDFDDTMMRLLLKVDTLYNPVPFELEPSPGKVKTYDLRAEWRPEQEYSLEIDSAATMSIYGKPLEKFKTSWSVARLEDFGTLFIVIPDGDTTVIVQLLDGGGKTVRQEKAKVCPTGGVMANFYYVQPGKYYVSCFFDTNGDGVWTGCNFDEDRHAERTCFLPFEIPVKGNFDIDQTWKLSDTPILQQKPRKLVKQKEDKKRVTAHERNLEREKNK